MAYHSFPLKPGIDWVGVLDKELEVFDIIMTAEFGSTYNAYVVRGSEKTALIETAKESFWEEFLERLQSVVDVKDIDYVVMDHTEPDHAGSLGRLLDLNPEIEVYSTVGAANFLGEILNKPFRSHTVKEGETLDLGGKTLQFMLAPNLHWPDTMYTYLPQDKVLFTCDSFGSHYCYEGVVRSTLEDQAGYWKAGKYYFDCILGPFKSFMNKALDRVEELDVEMICPGHGPVHDAGLPQLFATYREWSRLPEKNPEKMVVMAYVSAYGYTKTLARAIAQVLSEKGVDVRPYDLVWDNKDFLAEDLLAADGILLGSPTILGDALKPLYELCADLLPTIHGGKQAAAFGSYGWTGEAVPNLTARLGQLKMKVSDGYRCKFKPSQEQLAEVRAWAEGFAEKVLG